MGNILYVITTSWKASKRLMRLVNLYLRVKAMLLQSLRSNTLSGAATVMGHGAHDSFVPPRDIRKKSFLAFHFHAKLHTISRLALNDYTGSLSVYC